MERGMVDHGDTRFQMEQGGTTSSGKGHRPKKYYGVALQRRVRCQTRNGCQLMRCFGRARTLRGLRDVGQGLTPNGHAWRGMGTSGPRKVNENGEALLHLRRAVVDAGKTPGRDRVNADVERAFFVGDAESWRAAAVGEGLAKSPCALAAAPPPEPQPLLPASALASALAQGEGSAFASRSCAMQALLKAQKASTSPRTRRRTASAVGTTKSA